LWNKRKGEKGHKDTLEEDMEINKMVCGLDKRKESKRKRRHERNRTKKKSVCLNDRSENFYDARYLF
jgi:hypothetical protein